MRFLLHFLAFAVCPLTSVFSVEFQGANAILKQLADRAEEASKAEKPANPLEELQKKVTSFQKESDQLTPDQAAARWLALFDAYAVIPQDSCIDRVVTRIAFLRRL